MNSNHQKLEAALHRRSSEKVFHAEVWFQLNCDPCRSVISIKLFCNFIEITLQHGSSPVNLLHIFRTPFPKNISGGLLLKTQWNYRTLSQAISYMNIFLASKLTSAKKIKFSVWVGLVRVHSNTSSFVQSLKRSCRLCMSSLIRCIRSELFCKRRVLRNFTKFTGKHPCQSLFFNKVAVAVI